jgi:hypothetical protein
MKLARQYDPTLTTVNSENMYEHHCRSLPTVPQVVSVILKSVLKIGLFYTIYQQVHFNRHFS